MKIYLKQKVFAIGDKYDFTDADQKLLFQAKRPAMSLSKLYLTDPDGNERCQIHKKLFSFIPQYAVVQGGTPVMTVKKRLSFRPKYDITDNQGHAYTLEGDFGAYQFQLSYDGKPFGSVRKKLFSFGDAYELDVADGYDPALFCAIAVIIDQCLHNQKNR